MRYRFGGFELDPREGWLRLDGAPVEAQPKVIDALALFAARAGTLVTREELLAALWPGVHVTDDAVQQLVRKLRKALGDDARDARFLETVPRRGYRFLPAVESVEDEVAASPSRGQDPLTLSEATSDSEERRRRAPSPGQDPLTPSEATSDSEERRRTAPSRGQDPLTPSEATSDSEERRRRAATRGRGGLIAAAVALVAAPTAWLALRARPAAGPRLHRGACTPQRLTHSPEREQDGAFLPGGVVFVANDPDEGQYDLYVTSRAGAGRVRLTHTPGDEFYPQVSPDGAAILYTRGDGARLALWEIGPTGGEARLVVDDAAWGTWSPDGQVVAYVRQVGARHQLLTRAHAGGPERTVAEVDAAIESVAWSPDGSALAFVDGRRVWTVAAAGGAPRPASPAAGYLRTATWAGRALVSDGNYVGRDGLWWFAPGATPVPLTTNAGGLYHPAVGGADVLYTAESKQAVLSVPTAAGPARVPTTTAIECLDVSADGALVAFTDYDPARAGVDREAVVQDRGGARRDVLGPGACPRFSPDGARVAYLRDEGGRVALWTSPGDRFGPPDVVPLAAPAWTPDGRALVVATERGLARVEAARVTILAPGRFGAAAVAPDGTVAAGRDGRVVLVTAAGEVRPLDVRASYENRPMWVGEGLAVLTSERVRPEVVVYDRAGAVQSRAPLALPPDPSRWGVFEVAPIDGGWATLHTRYESDLFVLQDCVR